MQTLDERIRALFKRNWQQTLTYWSVFFSFGLCIAFLGPTILDLRCQTQSTLQQITWVFFCQQFFLLVGSSLGGLFKKTLLSSLLALFLCTLIISLVFAIIPLCHHVALLSVAMAIAGNVMGVIDTIGNLQLVNLYQKDSAIFLQALHFFIGLGALVSPLVADPFLSEDSCVLDANLTTNSSSSLDLQHLRSSMAGHGTALQNISQYSLHTDGVVVTRVSYAFWIIACINLPVPATVLALMYHERLLPRLLLCPSNRPRLLDGNSPSTTSFTGDGDQGHGSLFVCCNPAKLRNRPATFFILHALGGAILFITDGIIGSYAGFVYTYAVSPPLLMAHKMAGYLDSTFWASITVGRLAFIYLSYRYTAPRLLTFSLARRLLELTPLIHGLKEGSEDNALSISIFVGNLLKEKLELLPSFDFKIERAHRALASRPPHDSPPRSIVVKLIRFTDKEELIKIAWQEKGFIYEGRKVFLDHDYAPEVLRKRKEYIEAKKILRENKIHLQTPFPARLRVFYREETCIYNAVEEAMKDMATRGLRVTVVKPAENWIEKIKRQTWQTGREKTGENMAETSLSYKQRLQAFKRTLPTKNN